MSLFLQLEIAARLALAFVVGAILGFERTHQQKPAGSRTHSLVCLAAALFMIISLYGFGSGTDKARVAAQVVTGMGFIGAGAIWREGSWVKGITTATTLWVASALGLAIGAGLYVPALVALGLAYAGLEFYSLKRLLTGREEWLDRQLLIDSLDLGSLSMELERIFAYPMKFTTFNASELCVVSFTFGRSVPDPFTLTFSIKEKTVNLVLLYLPEHLRGRGYARRVVQVLLAWAKRQGFRQVTLTSTSEVAPMWEKLGFQRIDPSTFTYRLG